VLRLIRSQAKRKRPSKYQNSPPKRLPPRLRPNNKSARTKELSHSAVPELLGTVGIRDADPSLEWGPASKRFDPFNTLPIEERGNSHHLIFECKSNACLQQRTPFSNSINSTAFSLPTSPTTKEAGLQGCRNFSYTLHQCFADNQVDYTTFFTTNRPYSVVRPTFKKAEFLNFAISDAAVMHATLANITKTSYNLVRKSSPDIIYHVGQAITLVNKRIANCNQKAITKETIIAVACLTYMGVSTLSAFPYYLY
jgi:hypothetical protein